MQWCSHLRDASDNIHLLVSKAITGGDDKCTHPVAVTAPIQPEPHKVVNCFANLYILKV